MNAKMMSMLLAVVVLFALVGCKKEPTAGPGKTTRDTQTTTKSQTPSTTERAQQPAAVGGADANQTAAGRAQKQAREAAGTASDALAQQKQEYVQGAEQIVKGLEQKMTTLQQQASSLGQDGQQKAQQLQQRAQQELSNARAALDKMRTASGDQMKDAKVAADQAINNAETAFKDLQSFVESQRQVTRAQ